MPKTSFAPEEFPLLNGLPEAQIQRLLAAARVERFRSDEILFDEGACAIHLHALLRGTVELFRREEEQDFGLIILKPGSVFMPASALFREPYINSARTMGSSRVLLLDARVVRQEFRRSAEFAGRIAMTLAGQLRFAMHQILELKCRSAPQRLGLFLLRLVEENGTAGIARLPVPKRNLASRIGISAETLSRALQTLSDQGLVVRGGEVRLSDRSRLETYCHANESAYDTSLECKAL